MRTKIIPLISRFRKEAKELQEPGIETLVHACWHFAHCALWPEEHFSGQEIEHTLSHIRKYLEQYSDRKQAFTHLIERVVLADRYLHCQQSRYLPMPSVWFNPFYAHGFSQTRAWRDDVEKKRNEVPGYLQHIAAVADGFYQYTAKPSARVFSQCRRQLLRHKAYGLLQQYYSVIIHMNYLSVA